MASDKSRSNREEIMAEFEKKNCQIHDKFVAQITTRGYS